MNKSIVKQILDWNEQKFEATDFSKEKHPYLKAFGHGAIEGFVDAATLMYIPVLIGAYYWKHQAKKK